MCLSNGRPHLFRLTIEAFCPALFKTSFHSSSSPRIMYLKIEKISEPAQKKRGMPTRKQDSDNIPVRHILPQRQAELHQR